MVTMVGTQNNIYSAVQELIELDYDAVEAYEAALNRLEEENYKHSLEEFKADHQRHIKELTDYLDNSPVEAPQAGSMKKILTQGKVVIGNLIGGDVSILSAMQSNEQDTHSAYERMNQREDLNGTLKEILMRGWQDEKKHAQWLNSAIEKHND